MTGPSKPAAPTGDREQVEPSQLASPEAPKVAPESLALRGSPPPAIRFRRGVIIGICALGGFVLTGVSWYALRPQLFHRTTAASDDAVAARAPDGALAAMPASYADVPRLGPPLPGDLGKAVLQQRRQDGLDDAPAAQPPETSTVGQDTDPRRAALSSALMVRSSEPVRRSQEMTATVPANTAGDVPEKKLALDPERDPNAQQRKADFLALPLHDPATNPHRRLSPVSPYMLSAGSVIAASLVTGLRSDLPGQVIAQVSEPVFDSATGRILLIPQGARLLGTYDSVVAYGQKRALVVWQRLVFPDGSSLLLDNAPASDPAGYAGLSDKVDSHSWSLLKGAAIASLLGVGSDITFSGEGDLVRALRQSSQQNVTRAGDQLTLHNLQVQPTITVRPGARVRLIVSRDLVLTPWNYEGAKQ